MQTVTLAATGLEVTPLAHGTWGINVFDTAQACGCGQVTGARAARC